jgi:hypothetical protein
MPPKFIKRLPQVRPANFVTVPAGRSQIVDLSGTIQIPDQATVLAWRKKHFLPNQNSKQ